MSNFAKTGNMNVYEITENTHFYMNDKEIDITSYTHVTTYFMFEFGSKEWLIQLRTKGNDDHGTFFNANEILGEEESGEMEFKNTIKSKYSDYYYIDPDEKVNVKKITGLKLIEKQVDYRGGYAGPF